MITDVLNEVVQSNEHARPAHTGAAEQIENLVMSAAWLHVHPHIVSLWVPAMDRYGGVLVPVQSDSFNELDERAAGFWDSVFGPWCVVEVSNQDVVAMLLRWIHRWMKEPHYFMNTC